MAIPLKLNVVLPKGKISYIYVISQPDLLVNHVKLGRTDDHRSLKGRYSTPYPGHQAHVFMVHNSIEAEKHLFELASAYHYQGEIYRLAYEQAIDFCIQTQLWDLQRHDGIDYEHGSSPTETPEMTNRLLAEVAPLTNVTQVEIPLIQLPSLTTHLILRAPSALNDHLVRLARPEAQYPIIIEGIQIIMRHDIGTKIQGVLWENTITLPPIPNIMGKNRQDLHRIEKWLSEIAQLVNETEEKAVDRYNQREKEQDNNILVWKTECFENDEKGRMMTGELLPHYCNWCNDRHMISLTTAPTVFGKLLKKNGSPVGPPRQRALTYKVRLKTS